MNILDKVISKINTPKVFRKGSRENLRSSKMSTLTPSVVVDTKVEGKLTKDGKIEDETNGDKAVISDDIAIQILVRKEQEFTYRKILPLSKDLKHEILNKVQLTAEQEKELESMSKVFKTLKIEGKDELILHFLGEYIHENHLLGKQINAIKDNYNKITAKKFEEQIDLVGGTIDHMIKYHLPYKDIFNIQKDKLAVLILSLKDSPLKHISKETSIPLIIIGIFHMAISMDKELLDDLNEFAEIFQVIIDLISTNLQIPHLQICHFLERFDSKESLECFKNNDF